MKILFILDRYYPYLGGLNEYVKRISEELVKNGHQVSVLTQQYEKNLINREYINGVNVIRYKPLYFGNCSFAPSVLLKSYLLSKNYDLVNIHIPLSELSFIFFPSKRNLIITYITDVWFPSTLIERIKSFVYYSIMLFILKKGKLIITMTRDYALNSRVLKNHFSQCHYILPPVNEKVYRRKNSKKFKKEFSLTGYKVIGFVGRLAHEKGLLYLLQAIPLIKKRFKNIKVILAGPDDKFARKNDVGAVNILLERYKNDVLHMGIVPERKMPEFYSACDVLVLPSINECEAFGMVQVEAMFCGTPVVASDLPGMRQPVLMTKMGLLAKPKDSPDLAQKIIKVLENKKRYAKNTEVVKELFSIKQTIKNYEDLFTQI